jgi:hypothetical protein
MFRIAFFILVALSVASCAPSKETFDQRNAAMKADPKLRESVLKDCSSAKYDEQGRKDLAFVAKVPADKVLPVVCRRVLNAAINGKITYDDVAAFYRYHRVTPRMLNSLRGR